jgi:hypothetical protein
MGCDGRNANLCGDGDGRSRVSRSFFDDVRVFCVMMMVGVETEEVHTFL